MAMTEAPALAGGDAHEGANPGEIAIGVIVGLGALIVLSNHHAEPPSAARSGR